MYEQTFQFSSRPFNSVPRIEDFFAGLSYQQAIDVTHMCVDRSTGPVVVVGAVGMGKSLLLQKIGQSFESRFDVVHIECSRLEERSELLQSILFGLNLPYAGLSEGELRLSLMGYLKEGKGADDGVLLLVDEADRLSIELIDELRLITNQIRDGRSLVQLVLAGTQRLEDSLTDAKLASFNQRIAARCVLQNLSKQETQQFIYHHVEQAGRSGGEIFNEEAVDEVYHCTDGCPRLINQLCDQSLLLSASRNQQPVDRPMIREAWAEMQNMPVQSMGACAVSSGENEESECVVEFGQLGECEAACESEQGHECVEGDDPCEAQTPECTGEDEEAESDGGYEHQHDEEDSAEVVDASPEESSPLATHATAAALAATAFAAHAATSDPFAPQDDEQRLDDGDTEAERVASLEQEQETLFEQTRRQDESGSDEVRSAFEVLGLDEQEGEPPVVDEMIPADPFQAPVEAGDDADAQQEPDIAPPEVTEEVAEATEDDSVCEQGSSPMAQCSIEEQLGLVEPPAVEPTSFHTPAFEPRPFVESEPLQNQNVDDSQDDQTNSQTPTSESNDPFAEPFEEEEMLQDAYSPFVAEQNQASLDVTADQLSHLRPLDAVDDISSDAGADPWNSQTPELAIEELDATGVSADSAIAEFDSNQQVVDPFTDDVQASDDFGTAQPSAPEADAWQNNKDTAWDPSQYQVPSEVESETPASFRPVPSVPTELGPVAASPEEGAQPIGFSEDPFAPQDNHEAVQAVETNFPQSQDATQPTDEDLEALTRDLDSATTFDLNSQPNVPPVEAAESGGAPSGMMDLNDLMPSHLLPQMGAGAAQQSNFAAGVADDAQMADQAYVPDVPIAPEQPAGYAVPYSAHASASDFQSPEAAAQAEARRKTEEFMRNFQAQREAESQSEAEQVQPVQQSANAEQLTAHPEGQSQAILKEIFSQQQILDKVHYTDPPNQAPQQSGVNDLGNDQASAGQGADSVSVETPVTGFQDYQQPGEQPAVQDDRDMLYVNQTEHYSPPQAPEPPQPPPFPNVETSTGNAQRMDYNQLFEQLRNPSPE